MESPFASLMEHLACIEPCTLDLADKEDPLLSVLQHKGLQFEQAILASFRSQGLQVVSIERGKNAYQDTLNAMHKGVDIIYQAAFVIFIRGNGQKKIRKSHQCTSRNSF